MTMEVDQAIGDLARAIEIVESIQRNTSCPDPNEGGCIGGPIQGYGCVNEAAGSALRRLRNAHALLVISRKEAS